MLTGYVKKWDYSNCWGFIESDDDGYDYDYSDYGYDSYDYDYSDYDYYGY